MVHVRSIYSFNKNDTKEDVLGHQVVIKKSNYKRYFHSVRDG
jgi:hypothetical protein